MIGVVKKEQRVLWKKFVVDPKGNTIVEAGEEEEIVYATVDLKDIEKERISEPVLRSRRNELYEHVRGEKFIKKKVDKSGDNYGNWK